MKKQTSLFKNIIVATCLPLAGLAISSNVQAADVGKKFYVGLNIVPVSYRENTLSDFAAITLVLRRTYNKPTISQEAPSSGTLLTIGKEFSEKLSLELGIKDYGEQKVTYKNTNPAGDRYTLALATATSSILIGGKYNFRPQATVNIYTKFGFESWKSDAKSTVSASALRSLNGTTTTPTSGTALALAVGIDFPTQFGVLQVEIAPRSFENAAKKEILSSDLTFGYHYKF